MSRPVVLSYQRGRCFFWVMIKLIDALNQMEATDRDGQMIPFSLKYYTMDGDVINIEKGVKVVGQRNGKPVFDKHNGKRLSKNPNHFKNATRNIFIPSSAQIRKAKIRLMVEFNGQKICY